MSDCYKDLQDGHSSCAGRKKLNNWTIEQ